MNNISRFCLRSLRLSRNRIAVHSKQNIQLIQNTYLAPSQLFSQQQFRFSEEKKPEEKVDEQKAEEEPVAETEKEEEPVKTEKKEPLPNNIKTLLRLGSEEANKKALDMYETFEKKLKDTQEKLKSTEVQKKILDTANTDHLTKIDEFKKIIQTQNEELDLTVVRLRKERDQQKVFAISKFAGEILEVSDNLERAFTNSKNAEDDPLLVGTKMTYRSLGQILSRNGVEQMKPVGEKFNPEIHDALLYVPDETKEANTVSEVLTPGYIIGERILRPAKVIVVKPKE